ncbi:MAG: BtpA/SgcQ family protein [Promethearchaeota archaeon]
MSRKVKVIGMIHVPPLPGSPRYDVQGGLDGVIERCNHDLGVYLECGLDGAIFENFGDVPFYPTNVPPETIACMTGIICKCIQHYTLELQGNDFEIGVNVLRNDPQSALAIALATGARFIRVNIHGGAFITDQGIVEGIAHETLRFRRRVEARAIQIYADVHVKHATPLFPRSITQESIELVKRGLADCLIFTGNMTGEQPLDSELSLFPRLKKLFPRIPLFVGSGVDGENMQRILELTDGALDGFIIGTAFKKDGKVLEPVERKRVTKLLNLL